MAFHRVLLSGVRSPAETRTLLAWQRTAILAGCALSRANEKDETMPLYLSKFSYTPETWARLISNPEDRRKAAQAYIAA
jgi:hypothetical protein